MVRFHSCVNRIRYNTEALRILFTQCLRTIGWHDFEDIAVNVWYSRIKKTHINRLPIFLIVETESPKITDFTRSHSYLRSNNEKNNWNFCLELVVLWNSYISGQTAVLSRYNLVDSPVRQREIINVICSLMCACSLILCCILCSQKDSGCGLWIIKLLK